MICDSAGVMPVSLKIEADQRFFHEGVARADAVANGRHSNEGGPDAAGQPRLVLTRGVATLGPHPQNPKALLWNPAGIGLEQAWERLGVEGVLAVVGGTDVFGWFLEFGYDVFCLSRVPASVPDGRPVFPGVPDRTPEALLAGHGMIEREVRMLDERAGVTVGRWERG